VTETYWLNATNCALGAVVLISASTVAWTTAREVAARLRRRARISAELDRDMRELAAELDGHEFLDPDAGLTMADGGGKIEPNRCQDK
jgi:hypothetical protein